MIFEGEKMQNAFNDELLDPISNEILLLLSGGQRFTVHDLSKATTQSMTNIWGGIKSLQYRNFVREKEGKFELSDAGFEFLAKNGFHPAKPGGPSEPPSDFNFSKNWLGPLIGTWQNLFLWLLFPVLTSIVIINISALYILRLQNLYAEWIISLVAFSVIALIIYFYWKKSYHSVIENERLVVFRLGKCIGKRGPGPVLVLPFIDKPQSVDLRVKHQEVPHESCITHDNVQLDVDFVFYWRIENPIWSITKVTDPEESIRLLATALLRAVIAHFPFNDVLNQRESINLLLKDKIDEISSDWGVYVTTMEIREIKPPEEIVKSMHKQVSAEWQRKATIIEAEGQTKALEMLDSVASLMDSRTQNLKYFETLQKLGEGSATKYIFPLEFTNLIQAINSNNNHSDTEAPKLLDNENPSDKGVGDDLSIKTD